MNDISNQLRIYDTLDNDIGYEDLEELRYEYEIISRDIFKQLDNQLDNYEKRINLNQYTTNDPYIINIANKISNQLLRINVRDDYKKCQCNTDIDEFCLYRDVDENLL